MKYVFSFLPMLFLCASVNAQIAIHDGLEFNVKGILNNDASDNVNSVAYPMVEIDGRDLEKSLFFIFASRQDLVDFPLHWHISSIPDYDLKPSEVKHILETHLEHLKAMSSELYVSNEHIRNGEDVIDAVKVLKAKSKSILTHLDRHAPWPILSELKNPPTSIKNIMTDCCDYFYWYNSFLFLVGHTYKVPDPTSSDFQIDVSFTDKNIYKEKFKNGYVLVRDFDYIREKLLFSREVIKLDITNLIDLLNLYESKMANFASQIPLVTERNQTIFDSSSYILEKYLEKERAEAEEWIRKTNLSSSELKASVIHYDSIIASHSRAYYGIQEQIKHNELASVLLKKQVIQLTENSFVLLATLDSLKNIENRLLSDCNDQDASVNCVAFPDSLKMVSQEKKLCFESFTKLMKHKNELSDNILNIAVINDSLAAKSEISYNSFLEVRDKYHPIASAYILNQKSIKESMVMNREKYHLMNMYYNKLQIILGKQPDPLIIKIRESLRLETFKPRLGPIVDPINPWSPGWVDPIRHELLKELNIQEIRVDLNNNVLIKE